MWIDQDADAAVLVLGVLLVAAAAAQGERALQEDLGEEDGELVEVLERDDESDVSFQKCYEQKQYKNGLKFAKQILSNPKFSEHGGKEIANNSLSTVPSLYDFLSSRLGISIKLDTVYRPLFPSLCFNKPSFCQAKTRLFMVIDSFQRPSP